MATNFGLSKLRSKFDGWRFGRKEVEWGSNEANGRSSDWVEPRSCEIVDDPRQSNQAAELSGLIEKLVIPKLFSDNRAKSQRLGEQGLAELVGTDRKRPITSEDVVAFSDLTLVSEASTLLDFIDNCLATGSSVEAIYVDLLAPAARRLGKFWEDDSEDFVDVTMGLWRLQEVLRELALRVPPSNNSAHGQRSALFTTMPGEQHSFGTLMVAECFHRAGWDADVLIEPSQSELMQKFSDSYYSLAGLTISNDCTSAALTRLIAEIKANSRNPGICVMIGGRLVNENPNLAELCGADGTAEDANGAIAIANSLVPVAVPAPDLLV